MINTNYQIKKKLLPVFCAAMKAELLEGKKKYGHSTDKEYTDLLMEFDEKYFLSNMMKYIGRVKNGDSRAKRDLTKIATYAFLQWVKQFGEEELRS